MKSKKTRKRPNSKTLAKQEFKYKQIKRELRKAFSFFLIGVASTLLIYSKWMENSEQDSLQYALMGAGAVAMMGTIRLYSAYSRYRNAKDKNDQKPNSRVRSA